MKLHSIQLSNFRQFYGTTPRLKLADGETNVTIFHGANGSGKTTILNAMTWILYGETTAAFASPEFLINKRFLKEAPIGNELTCSVELTFEHLGKKYTLKRMATVLKTGQPHVFDEGPTRAVLSFIQEDGMRTNVPEDEIPDVIGRIIPRKLLPYFFFDGERIESLQRSNKQPDVIAATTMLVGEEVLNRSIRHLTEARKSLEADLRKIGDAQTAELIDQKTQLETQVQEKQAALEALERNLNGFEHGKRTTEAALREHAGAQEMQKRRDHLSAQRSELMQSLSTSRTALASHVSSQGYHAYLRGAIHTFKDILSGLHRTGELPAPFKATFVRELLESQQCVCERPLIPGEDPHKAVEAWLQRTGISDVEEVVFRMTAEVDQADRTVPEFFERVNREQQSRIRIREQLSRVEEELDKVRDELRGSRVEDARKLEERRQLLEESIKETNEAIFEARHEVRGINDDIALLDREIARREGVNDQHRLASHRLAACSGAIDTIHQVRDLLRANFREDLAERINDLFSQMSFKPYRATLDPDYRLSLVDGPGDTPVGPSTGESALLSLSFLGAVISQAKDLTARKDRLPGPDSSVFPVVMDSPFGNLDPTYRRQVAQHIPGLANQVLVMASKSQFEGDVEATIHPKIGREFVLRYHSPRQDAHEDKIVRNGMPYELVIRSSDADEWTEIVEVK